jgi:transcriptional regulator with XRE-family HTH domain
MLRGRKLADFLKSARTSAGLSQKEVAVVLGYKSSQFVSNWERGLSSPPIGTLRHLCGIYKTDEREVFEIIRDIAIKKLETDLEREFYADRPLKKTESV